MKLDAKLEVTNNLASKKGFRRDPATVCQISIAKESNSNKYYMFVNSSKNPIGDKFRISNNVERMFCKFVHEGKATVILKDPPFTFAIQKAEVNQLKTFLKLFYLAEKSSADLAKELENSTPTSKDTKLGNKSNNILQTQQQENTSFKKPITSLTISSGKDYDRNFRQIISQNLRAQTQNGEINLLNLTKLALTNCDLKRIHPAVLTELTRLEHLDMSSNRLTAVSLSGFNLPRLITLILANNQIDHIPAKITLPRLCTLDLSSNRLVYVGRVFSRAFASVSQLNLNSNLIESFHADFFHRHRMANLLRVQASGNRLKQMPFSLASTRFELLELNDNPFESLVDLLPSRLEKFSSKFPTLAELSARRVVDSRLKYKFGDIPTTLIDYLDTSVRCHCGRACFAYNFTETTQYELSRIANSFSYVRLDSTSTNHLVLLVTSCSLKCYHKYFRSRR